MKMFDEEGRLNEQDREKALEKVQWVLLQAEDRGGEMRRALTEVCGDFILDGLGVGAEVLRGRYFNYR